MKNNRFLLISTIFFGCVMFLLSIYTAKMFINNYFVNYEKEVYLGGDNIVIDFASNNDDETVTKSKSFLTVGTMTYIDLDNNYAAVAHNLNGNMNKGSIFITPVYSVLKSTKNRIGEKDILLKFDESNGVVNEVKDTGVYGKFNGDTSKKELIKLGMPSEIEKGEALIITNIEGSEIKAYKINIEKVNYIRNHHNIYFKIVDEELLNKTGGIISGMSGSPIVQNGKIIGSLSHVNTDNPIYGYGLFITNM